MNDNHEDTPNPLNPKPATQATDASHSVNVTSSRPKMPQTTSFQPIKTEPQNASVQPVAVSPQTTGTTPEAIVTEVKADRRILKRKGLIIGGIIAVFLAVGCGVVAALLLLNAPNDPVAMAAEKFINDGYKQNAAIDGKIDITLQNDIYPYSNLKIDLKAQMVGGTAVNSANATITATERKTGKSVSVVLDEVYPDGEDLYFRLSGTTEAINTLNNINQIEEPEPVIDCDTDEESGCVIDDDSIEVESGVSKSISETDGVWIRITKEEIKQMMGDMNMGDVAKCAVSYIRDVRSSMNEIAIMYQQNPFLVSTTEDVTIARRATPVRRIAIDKTNFTNFVDSAKESTAVKNFFGCMGTSTDGLDADGLVRAMSKLPSFYVEVNDQYQFTRFYFTYSSDTGSITTDLNFSYPGNVNIVKPEEYKDFSTLVKQYSEDK